MLGSALYTTHLKQAHSTLQQWLRLIVQSFPTRSCAGRSELRSQSMVVVRTLILVKRTWNCRSPNRAACNIYVIASVLIITVLFCRETKGYCARYNTNFDQPYRYILKIGNCRLTITPLIASHFCSVSTRRADSTCLDVAPLIKQNPGVNMRTSHQCLPVKIFGAVDAPNTSLETKGRS